VKSGESHQFCEFNLRFKTDSSTRGFERSHPLLNAPLLFIQRHVAGKTRLLRMTVSPSCASGRAAIFLMTTPSSSASGGGFETAEPLEALLAAGFGRFETADASASSAV
jgi:hypothetical protein